MTDTTHEAPKRIWADGNAEWDSGSWGLDKEFDNDVEYVRADLVQAAVAAERERAYNAGRKHERDLIYAFAQRMGGKGRCAVILEGSNERSEEGE